MDKDKKNSAEINEDSLEKNLVGSKASYPRLDRLGLMVAGMTHNLNGSLTAMLGFLDILCMIQPDLKDHVVKVMDKSKRLKNDIAIILTKAQMEGSAQIRKIDLNDIVQLEMDYFKADPRFKHEIEVVFQPCEGLPSFHCDPGDFIQVIDQVLFNALEALEKAKTPTLTVTLNQEDDNILLIMKDNGVGMDENTLSRAFEPFFSNKEKRDDPRYPVIQALGIGLTHSKNILNNLDCKIELESELNKGTIVTITIPYKQVDSLYV